MTSRKRKRKNLLQNFYASVAIYFIRQDNYRSGKLDLIETDNGDVLIKR